MRGDLFLSTSNYEKLSAVEDPHSPIGDPLNGMGNSYTTSSLDQQSPTAAAHTDGSKLNSLLSKYMKQKIQKQKKDSRIGAASTYEEKKKGLQ